MPFPQRIGPTLLTNSLATIFTANRPVIVTSLLIANTSASAVTVLVSLVPVGGTSAASNRIIPDLSVLANDVLKRDLDVVMNAGDTLQALASVTNVINITGTYGDEKKVLRG